MSDLERSRAARRAAERALVRIVHHYGTRPEFVLLGGLVPELLCAGSNRLHAGTTDVDVQVDLEIAYGADNMGRLEKALRNAEFEPDKERVWRWLSDEVGARILVEFELLADIDTVPRGATVVFDACEHLGAANLRGTGFASRDPVVQEISARIGGVLLTVEINVAGLAGFLLAKAAAAYDRRKPKDWYDIAFVLLNNDLGGVRAAAGAVRGRFGADLFGWIKTPLDDLLSNFTVPSDQGPAAYAEQTVLDHPEMDYATMAADAVLAVRDFHRMLFS